MEFLNERKHSGVLVNEWAELEELYVKKYEILSRLAVLVTVNVIYVCFFYSKIVASAHT